MSGREGSLSIGRVCALALAFGAVAGTCEGVAVLWTQARGLSRWPVSLSSGDEVVWFAALLDAAVVLAAALAAALVAAAARRRIGPGLVACLGAALLVYLVLRSGGRLGRGVSLAAAAGAGAVAWGTARRFASGLARNAWRIGAGAALLVLASFGWDAGGARLREMRLESALPPAEPGARDVLIVVLDTVRNDHLSAYGYARDTTPVLRRLAAEGARFDACFSTSSWTLPAHASLLTGRIPWEHGAALQAMDATFPVLGETFAAHGRRTGAFSGNTSYFHRGFGFGRGFHRFDDFGWSLQARLFATGIGRELDNLARTRLRRPVARPRKSATEVVDAFLGWLDRGPERPYFAVLNWFDGHDPYRPPPPFRGRFAHDGIEVAPPPPGSEERALEDPARLSADAQAYDECVLSMDSELGRLVGELERRGRARRTVLVVTGDHGESFGERGARRHRGSLHRDQTQVPLIVHAPGLVPAGIEADGVASIAALPATLVELLGFADPGFPGPSLAAVLRGDAGGGAGGDGDSGEEASALLELARHPWPEYKRRPSNSGAARSLVRGRWHYVWHETLGESLFDRVADPREETDLAAENPQIVRALRDALEAELAARTRHPAEPSGADLSDRPELGGVGYIDDGH